MSHTYTRLEEIVTRAGNVELRAAELVQRHMREWKNRRHTWTQLGRTAADSNHGCIDFGFGRPSARFITIAPGVDPERLMRFVRNEWQLLRPQLLLTVTGGSTNFSLMPQLQRALDRGMAAVAQAAQPWVFTVGTATGCMRLVAMALEKCDLQVPLIGIPPLSKVSGREELLGLRGGVAVLNEEVVSSNADLNKRLSARHSHFLLVDDGAEESRRSATIGDENAPSQRSYPPFSAGDALSRPFLQGPRKRLSSVSNDTSLVWAL